MAGLGIGDLSKFIVVVTSAVTMAAMLLAILRAAREVRIRPAFEWGRIAVGVGGIVVPGVIVGVNTPAPYALIAVGFGLFAGFAQGWQTVVTMRGTELWARRTLWAIIVWSVGLVGMQLAGLGSSTGVFQVGQAVALFSIAVSLGVMMGRQKPGRAAQAGGAAVAAVFAVAGLLSLSVARPAQAQDDDIELLTGEVQVTLTWSGPADLDLYVEEPDGSRISYSSPNGSLGGQLSHDSNAGCEADSGSFVENIAWVSGTPSGTFYLWVENFSQCTEDRSGSQGFRMEIRAGGVVEVVDTGTLSDGGQSNPVVIEVDNLNVAVPEIVSADGGENLNVDPAQTGDGSRPTEVDEAGNPIGIDGSNGREITPEEAITAGVAAAATALGMAGLTVVEGGQSVSDLFRTPVNPPPPAPGSGWVESEHDEGTRTRIDLGNDGTETTTQLDREGRVISQHVSPARPAGTGTLVGTNADGSTSTIESHQDGATTETRVAPDGSSVTIERDPYGTIISTQPVAQPPMPPPAAAASVRPPAAPETPATKPVPQVVPARPVRPGAPSTSDEKVGATSVGDASTGRVEEPGSPEGATTEGDKAPTDATANAKSKDELAKLSQSATATKDRVDEVAAVLGRLKESIAKDQVMSDGTRRQLSAKIEAIGNQLGRASNALGVATQTLDKAKAVADAIRDLDAGLQKLVELHQRVYNDHPNLSEGLRNQVADMSTAIVGVSDALATTIETYVPYANATGAPQMVRLFTPELVKALGNTVENVKQHDTRATEYFGQSERDKNRAAVQQEWKRLQRERAKTDAFLREKYGPSTLERLEDTGRYAVDSVREVGALGKWAAQKLYGAIAGAGQGVPK